MLPVVDAIKAFPARNMGFRGHPVPDRKAGDPAPHLDGLPGHFVAEDVRVAEFFLPDRVVMAKEVKVCSADAGRPDSDQDLIRPDGRDGHFLKGQRLSGGKKHESFHESPFETTKRPVA
jgi:hypothetical protein